MTEATGTDGKADREEPGDAGGPGGSEEPGDREEPGDAGGPGDSGEPGSAEGREPDEDPEEIAAERKKRLDPENRPKTAEVDNTNREFDSETGMFTDSEGHEDAEAKFIPEGEL